MKTITKPQPAWLMLQDGTILEGLAVGASGTTGGEICFNTGMTGYQEIFTDPSYYGQVIVTTVAHVGNYGVKQDETESNRVQFSGLICNKMSKIHTRRDADNTLNGYLADSGITGISEIDTRYLVRHIRDKGVMNVVISTISGDPDFLQAELDKLPDMLNLELSTKVTTSEPYDLPRTDNSSEQTFKVAVLDFGVKKGILENMQARGMDLRVFPATTTYKEMEEWKPNGYFLSNGPGDPAVMGYAIDTVKEILSHDRPIFGICLGHQILALAVGLQTYKMHNGHRGINHPVKNLITGKGEITSQNHGFAVSSSGIESLEGVEITHINLNDQTVEGMRLTKKPAFSVQHHPESNPGPHDSRYLFDQFRELIQKTFEKS